MTSLQPTGLIFDLDGTLIESAPAITAVANEFLATIGQTPLVVKETISFIGGGSQQFVQLMLESRGAYLPAEFESHYARFSEIYLGASPEQNHAFPGAEAALRALAARGYPLALCTNKPEAPTQRIVDALGWRDLFPVVIAGDTLAVKKPDPAPLREAARQLGVAQLLYVGDSETDAATAEAADERFLLFTEGYRKTEVAKMRHTASFSDYGWLEAIVSRLTQG